MAHSLQQWMAHPEMLDRDTLYELRTLLARYPYFQTARLLYLKNLYLLHDEAFGAELRRAVLYVTDRRMLFHLIEGECHRLQPIRPSAHPVAMDENPEIDRTLSLIDAFLSTLPEEHSQDAPMDYTADYTAYLLQESEEAVEEEVPRLRGQELIDGFIQQSEAGESMSLRQPADGPDETAGESPFGKPDEVTELTVEEMDESCFTETLAKIYVKQHRYEKALEIIKKLSLNYPKKNAYFADQIRFLEKLIINAKSK